MGIITSNNATKSLRLIRPEGQDGGQNDVWDRMDQSLNDTQTLRGLEVLGQGSPGRRTIPVDMDLALDQDFPYWRQFMVYITGIAKVFDRVPVDKGLSGFQPRAIINGLVSETQGMRPAVITYSLPFSRSGSSRWTEAQELAEAIMALPLKYPVLATFAGATKFVRTNRGDVAHVNISQVGDVIVPDYMTAAEPEPVNASVGHPCLQRPSRPMEVKGYWGYNSMPHAHADGIEAFCQKVRMDLDGGAPFPDQDSESPMGEDLEYVYDAE